MEIITIISVAASAVANLVAIALAASRLNVRVAVVETDIKHLLNSAEKRWVKREG